MAKFKEGEEHFIWLTQHTVGKLCLAEATLNACDHCKNPATVNSVWVIGTASSEMTKQADELLKEYGELTELGADSEGSAFCEFCYPKHAVLEA